MIKDAILNFASQFAFEPEVVNADVLQERDNYIVAGMGGSGLVADVIKALDRKLFITAHKDFGLPRMPDELLRKSLIIFSSYSGNTDETLDAFDEAVKNNLTVAAVASGGKLLERAKAAGAPFVRLPDTGIAPRMALGFSLRAVLKLMGNKALLEDSLRLSGSLEVAQYEARGREIAEKLRGKIPLIYASGRNSAVAYNWKIRLNETGKTPAFYNLEPELNHNEIVGFDGGSANIPRNFAVIFVEDPKDDQRIIKRMKILADMLQAKGLTTESVKLMGEDRTSDVFSSIVLADWTAWHLAALYGSDSDDVKIIEDFKKLAA